MRFRDFFLDDKLLSASILITFVIFYVSTAFISGSGILNYGVRLSDYEVGKVAEKDIIVDRDIEYIDDKATELKREAQVRLVPPVFRVTEDIKERVLSSFDKFSIVYTGSFNDNKTSSEIYLELQSELPGFFEESQVEELLSYGKTPDFIIKTREVLNFIMTTGVVSIPDNLKLNSNSISILKWSNGEKVTEEVALDEVYTLKNLDLKLAEIYNSNGRTEDETAVVFILIKSFIEENAFYDSEQTELRRLRVLEQVEPVVKKIVKDEVIVKKGFIITEDDMIKVTALGNYSDTMSFTFLFGKMFYLIIIFFIAYNLFKPPVLVKKPAKTRLYLLLILFSIYILGNSLLVRFLSITLNFFSSVFLPIALFTMLISILMNTRTGILSAVILSLTVFILPGNQVDNFIFTFISGVFGSLIVYKAQHRITLIKAGVILSLINAAVVIALGLIKNIDISYYPDAILISVVNGFLSGVLTLGLLPILEHMLNAPTPFRLMELSDLNTPLFKRMLILAPGTYSHSVSVANLSETAAKEIGANALLARVGAYYHDIGKIDQAEYFIENQTEGNKHDELKATLSTAVIKSHVKLGYEKAKELGLPDEVIEIVSQHHGSGKLNYFYMKALKEQKNEKKLSPEDFSYSGTPPVSREAAVVMLADTVEAATRTLKNPTVAKLERFVWDLIMEKVSSGQMKNSGLTFNDLDIIKKSFVQILGGSFHKRIEYPNQNGDKTENE